MDKGLWDSIKAVFGGSGDRQINVVGGHSIVEVNPPRALIPVEPLYDAPVRPRGSTNAANLQSFADLVFHNDPNNRAVIYNNRADGNLIAVLNDNAGGHAGWRDWRINYNTRYSESWAAWCRINGQYQSQEAMAEFIQDRVADFVTPAGAHMLEVAQRFEITRGGKFSSGVRLDSGMTELTVEDTATVKTISNVQFPEMVDVGMRVFDDLEGYKFKVRFRYRVKDGTLSLCFKIVDKDAILLAALVDLAAKVKAMMPNHKYILATFPIEETARLRLDQAKQ